MLGTGTRSGSGHACVIHQVCPLRASVSGVTLLSYRAPAQNRRLQDSLRRRIQFTLTLRLVEVCLPASSVAPRCPVVPSWLASARRAPAGMQGKRVPAYCQDAESANHGLAAADTTAVVHTVFNGCGSRRLQDEYGK